MNPCITKIRIKTREGWKKSTDLGTGLGDSTQIVDEVGLGHTDTSITNGENLVLLVRGDADVELLAGVKNGGVGQG